MSKILAIFGATGTQGTSIINHILTTPSLRQTYTLRALTRNPSSPASQSLQSRGVSIVQADANDYTSLTTALKDTHTVFAMTTPSLGPDAFDIEYQTAKRIADACLASGVQYLIFSTLPGIREISAGKYTACTPFDAKAAAEKYIRNLPIKSAFFSPGGFMQNYTTLPFLNPKKDANGTYILSYPNSPHTLTGKIDAERDTGKFIGAILSDPEKFEGKTLAGASALHTWDEVAGIMSRVTGEKVVYRRVGEEEFKGMLPFLQDSWTQTYLFFEEFGVWGPGSRELLEWSIENVGEELTSLEDYFQRCPLELQG